MRKLWIVLALWCLLPIGARAAAATEFDAASVFTDNMVLQADREIVIYGTSPEEGAGLTVFLEEEKQEITIKDGRWEARFGARPAGGEPFAVQIVGSDSAEQIFIENVTMGDVWLVLGQSNVEFSATALPDWDELCQKLPKNARLLTFTSADLAGNLKGARSRTWRPMTWLSAAQASALGVLLCDEISISTGFERPQGLISAGFRGQELSAFLPPELSKDMETAAEEPSLIYEAVLSGIDRFPIRGLVWYQGEANGIYYKEYTEKFSEFIRTWREKAGHFPVYIVELAPCFPGDEPERQFLDFGTVRGAIGTLPMHLEDIWVCPTSDLFSDRAYINSLHPPNKTVLSYRVLGTILEKSYGIGNGAAPQVTKIEYGEAENEVRLFFSMPLQYKEMPRGFSGIDEDWNPVEMTDISVNGNEVRLTFDRAICIVRYGAKADDVYGETLSLCGENGQIVPQLWYKLREPKGPSQWAWMLLYATAAAARLWPLFLILLGGAGILWIRKKRKR